MDVIFKLMCIFIFILCINESKEDCALQKQFLCEQNSTTLNCGNFTVSGQFDESAFTVTNKSKIIFRNVTIQPGDDGSIETGYCQINKKLFRNSRKYCYFDTESKNISLLRKNNRRRKCVCFFPVLKNWTFHSCKHPSTRKRNAEKEDPLPLSCNLSYFCIPLKQSIEVKVVDCEADINKVSVRLFSPSQEINCTKKNGGFTIEEVELDLKNGDNERTFNNLKTGNYCVHVFRQPSWNSEVISSFVLWIPPMEVQHTQRTSINEEPAVDKKPSKIQQYMWAFFGVIVAILVLAVLLFLAYNKRRPVNVFEVHENITEELETKTKNVFCVYNCDSQLHMQVIELMAEILEKYLDCKVSWRNDHNINEIMKNRAGFIKQKLRYSHKIIFINSEGSFSCFMDLIKHKKYKMDSVNDIFCETLNEILHYRGKSYDYKNIISMRFQYTDQKFIIRDITPDKHYNIPEQMEEMFCHIHELNPVEGGNLFKKKLIGSDIYFQLQKIIYLQIENNKSNLKECDGS